MLGDYLQMKKEERDLYKPKDKQLRIVDNALLEYNPNDGTTKVVHREEEEEKYGYIKKDDGSIHRTDSKGDIKEIHGADDKYMWVDTVDEDGNPIKKYMKTSDVVSHGNFKQANKRTPQIITADGKVAFAYPNDGRVVLTDYDAGVKNTKEAQWKYIEDSKLGLVHVYKNGNLIRTDGKDNPNYRFSQQIARRMEGAPENSIGESKLKEWWGHLWESGYSQKDDGRVIENIEVQYPTGDSDEFDQFKVKKDN